MVANEMLLIYRRCLLGKAYINLVGDGQNMLGRKLEKNQHGISVTLYQGAWWPKMHLAKKLLLNQGMHLKLAPIMTGGLSVTNHVSHSTSNHDSPERLASEPAVCQTVLGATTDTRPFEAHPAQRVHGAGSRAAKSVNVSRS